MTVCDSSVLIAAFASWHDHHGPALRAVESSTGLLGHAAFETLSVATRMPQPFRAEGPAVLEFLDSWYPGKPLTLTGPQVKKVLAELTTAGVSGGAVYDGLIARTAATHGQTLVSLDQRASLTYTRLGTEFTLIH